LRLRVKCVPDSVKRSTLFPLLKGEGLHPGDPAQRRPIMLIPVILKVLQCILARRQYGFVRGRTLETPVAALIDALMDANVRKEEVHIVALDVAKAYDSIDFEKGLRRGLEELNLERGFLEYIDSLYTGRKARIITSFGLSGEYNIERGISQGDPMSCILFVFFMETIRTGDRSPDQGICGRPAYYMQVEEGGRGSG